MIYFKIKLIKMAILYFSNQYLYQSDQEQVAETTSMNSKSILLT